MAQAHVPTLPQALVEEEKEAMRRMVAASMGLPEEKAAEMLDAGMFEAEARAQVARMILVGELARLWQLELDKDRLVARLQEVARAQNEPYQKVLEAYRDHAGFRSGISLAVMEEQVLDVIEERFGTESVDMGLQQAMEVAA
jgi:FKBP-type peptidyl-prolyl cis-trans isomerase (trigger factor)